MLSIFGIFQTFWGASVLVLGTLALFIAITLAVATYPFDPHHDLSITLVVVFVILGGVITFVYADMHRNATLSNLTNTTPGELGSDFWFKILGFGIGPLIGLMTTIFPEIGVFVLSWLSPDGASRIPRNPPRFRARPLPGTPVIKYAIQEDRDLGVLRALPSCDCVDSAMTAL